MTNFKKNGSHFFLVSTLLLTGCSTATRDLVDSGEVVLSYTTSADATFLYADVNRTASITTVSGVVSLNSAEDYEAGKSHIDIVLRMSDNSPTFVAYVPYERAGHHGHPNQAKFKVSVHLHDPAVAMVVLAHHPEPIEAHLMTEK